MTERELAELLETEIYPCLRGGVPQGTQPEAFTKASVIEPILDAIGYTTRFRRPENRVRDSGLEWIDYLLLSTEPVAFVEAKAMSDRDLWNRHKDQVLRYIHAYRLSPGADEAKTVRWLFLTNGSEWHIMNVLDRRPFKSFTIGANALEDARALLSIGRELLNRLLADYNESRGTPLGDAFMADLKMWREHIATALLASSPNLTVDELADYSQRVLDQIIFIRALETTNLQPSFGILRYYNVYETLFLNQRAVPFARLLQSLIIDLEADLNTELLKQIPDAVATLPNEAFKPVIVPFTPIPGVTLAANSVYSYDFRDLTFDLLGEIYEQYLGQALTVENDRVSLVNSRSRRSEEGAFYTRAPVVRFTTYLAMRSAYNSDDPEIIGAFLRDAKIVDISCGSGAFLLAAYNALRELRLRFDELAFGQGTLADGTGTSQLMALAGSLPLARDVVATELFGIDKDPEAVEIARLNLWLELIKSSDLRRERSTTVQNRSRLPSLGGHVIAADSIQSPDLMPYFDILQRLTIEENKQVVFLGNPPWGADLTGYHDLRSHYETFSSSPNSAALFVERIVESLPTGGIMSLVLPESTINRGQYAAVRQLLTNRGSLIAVTRLGEGFFEGVSRSAVVIAFKKDVAQADHHVKCFIFTKEDRQLAMGDDTGANRNAASAQHLIRRFESEGWSISQAALANENDAGWNIFATDQDRPIMEKMAASGLTFRPLVKGRGVELNQAAIVVKCADCGAFVPRARPTRPPRAPRQPWEKRCDNCGLQMRATSQVKTLLDQQGDGVRFVLGGDIHSRSISTYHKLSLEAAASIPSCPACGFADAQLGETGKTGKRTCVKCNEAFDVSTARRKLVGIKYKNPSLYSGEKVLVRKTGRGIYAALDKDSYCSQIVYVVRADGTQYDPAFLLGILSSRAMLYLYYKRLGIIEWQSYPHITLDDLKALPIPSLDLTNAGDKALHDEIAAQARELSSYPGHLPEETNSDAMEILVRRAFGITADEGQVIDEALQFIARLGTLLAEQGEGDEGSDEDEENVSGEE